PMNPWPRQFVLRSALVLMTLAVALILRAPRVSSPPVNLGILRDSVGDHATMLSKGHSSLSCSACHFAHTAKPQQPLWQKQRATDATLFARDSSAVGGASLCMSCHDGTVASNLQAHGGGDPMFGSGVSGNHPVGVDYRAAVRRDPSSYNDPMMNDRIVLEEGKVGCLSCHATHDLSAVSAGSVRREVCIECHRR
ncbi:MAG: hypothetical protein ABL955_10330, partial [Elusimicrobiota bacterium]